MSLRTAIIATVTFAGVAGCAPARPVVVERERVYDPYDGYSHTVIVEEDPPPVVVVGPPVYFGGGYGYGPRYRHWR